MIPLINSSAIYFKRSRTLAVAELHIGLGSSQQVADKIFEDILLRLDLLISRYSVRRLIINGDLKERVGRPGGIESRLLKRFDMYLSEKSVITTLVKGNHDGLIENFVSFRTVRSKKLTDHDEVFEFVHGHSVNRDFHKADWVVIAHLHPSVLVAKTKSFAWIFARRSEGRPHGLVVMPPFNRFVGGGRISRASLPILKRLGHADSWRSYVVSTDGRFLGDLDFVSRNL